MLPAAVWATGVWLLQEPLANTDAHVLTPGIDGLWLAQAVVVAVLGPLLAAGKRFADAIAGGIAIALLPTPLVCLAWLMGALSLHAALAGPGFIAGVAIGLVVVGRGIHAWGNHGYRTKVGVVLMQAVSVAALVGWGPVWLEWLVP